MARLRLVASTEGEVALVAATAKTVMQVIAASNHRVALRSFGVFFDGTSGSAEPVLVELVRQTTAGTVTSATPVREDVGSETIQTTSSKNATVEPTTTDVIRYYNVHPQTGTERVFGPDEEIILAGGTRLGLRCTAPANVNCVAFMSLEE